MDFVCLVVDVFVLVDVVLYINFIVFVTLNVDLRLLGRKVKFGWGGCEKS